MSSACFCRASTSAGSTRTTAQVAALDIAGGVGHGAHGLGDVVATDHGDDVGRAGVAEAIRRPLREAHEVDQEGGFDLQRLRAVARLHGRRPARSCRARRAAARPRASGARAARPSRGASAIKVESRLARRHRAEPGRRTFPNARPRAGSAPTARTRHARRVATSGRCRRGCRRRPGRTARRRRGTGPR